MDEFGLFCKMIPKKNNGYERSKSAVSQLLSTIKTLNVEKQLGFHTLKTYSNTIFLQYNMDEFGLFCKMIPKKTMVMKGETSHG